MRGSKLRICLGLMTAAIVLISARAGIGADLKSERSLAQGVSGPPVIEAASAILVDADTGTVLYQHNADERRPLASLTKLMTALLILEQGKLDELVTASEDTAQCPESSLLEPGEQIPMNHLLQAILIKSANDGALAAAQHVSGSEEAFVEEMNLKAAQLGADNTHFANPHGLYHPNHYSTARDIALIARHAVNNRTFCHIVKTKRMLIPWPGHPHPRVLRNRNKLLWKMPSADGIKTGYVKESGKCLVASATRQGWKLIAVLLDSKQLWEESAALLDYGFSHFRHLVFARRGQVVATVPLRRGAEPELPLLATDQLSAVLEKGKNRPLQTSLQVGKIKAPVVAGQRLGQLRLMSGESTLESVDLVAGKNIGLSWIWIMWGWIRTLFWMALVVVIGAKVYGKAAKNHGRCRRRLPQRVRTPNSLWKSGG